MADVMAAARCDETDHVCPVFVPLGDEISSVQLLEKSRDLQRWNFKSKLSCQDLYEEGYAYFFLSSALDQN